MPRYLLVAGLDFGTSYSKVVLREQNTRRSVAVRFPGHADGLLPSLVGFDGTHLFPPLGLAHSEPVPYLKMLAAEVAAGSPFSQARIRVPRAIAGLPAAASHCVTIELLAFYFAHMIASVRQFILTASPWPDFDITPGNSSDHLVFQLAVPTGLLAQDGRAEKLFREALILAHELAAKADPNLVAPFPCISWSREIQATRTTLTGRTEDRYQWQCLIYPEVAAAVQTVFRSPNARDGLYITMDVGAGTVDINAFLRNTGEHLRDQVPTARARRLDYYAAAVKPLGIHNLLDPHGAVESRTEQSLMHDLRSAVWALYHQAKRYQPNHGHRRGFRTWDRATFFVLGGGAHHSAYVANFAQGLTDAGIADPRILKLPAADLECPSETEFGRFAVAYGMAFFKPSLDDVRLPSDLRTFSQLYPPTAVPPPAQYGFNWED
jgi:hypothetical protein